MAKRQRLAEHSYEKKPAGLLRGIQTPLVPILGVLFDLDGTLVDTEHLTPIAWRAVLAEVGVQPPPDIDSLSADLSAPPMRGSKAVEIADFLTKKFSIDPQYSREWLANRKRTLAVEQITSGSVDLKTTWFDGVAQSVLRLVRKLGPENVGLCSSNLRTIVSATLEAGGVEMVEAFRAGGITVQEDVGANRIKPDPTSYKRSLRLLGQPPSTVVAMEDSVVGVRSAVAAGVGVVLGVLNNSEEEEAKVLLDVGASAVFSSTVEAIDWCISHAGEHISTEAAASAAAGSAAAAKEEVVRRYFDGVNKKDGRILASCFAKTVELRDMCNPVSKGAPRFAAPQDMANRCLEFLAAHPDCRVSFEAPPRTDRNGEWVWCHWAETGSWTGESRGIAPQGTPLNVGGHTRFLVERKASDAAAKDEQPSWHITKQVVFRTFADWELALLSK